LEIKFSELMIHNPNRDRGLIQGLMPARFSRKRRNILFDELSIQVTMKMVPASHDVMLIMLDVGSPSQLAMPSVAQRMRHTIQFNSIAQNPTEWNGWSPCWVVGLRNALCLSRQNGQERDVGWFIRLTG